MASPTVLNANVSPLKRSFDHVTPSLETVTCYYEGTRERRQHAERRSLSVSTTTITPQKSHRHTKRRTLSVPSTNSMLTQSPTIMSGSFPSFMSVYGNEDSNLYNHALSGHDAKPEHFGFSHFSTNTNQPQLNSPPRLIERRGSVTSTTSYSTESSPTTTSSTFDSPLMGEQTPDTSPESATQAIPKSFYQPLMRSAGTQTVDYSMERRISMPPRPAPVTEQIDEGPRRNLRNLTIDMKLPSLIRPGNASDGLHALSGPASPLREPPKTGRRKPTNLTIRTPSFNQVSFGANALAIPPTPGQKPVLHHSLSTPSLPVLSSPTHGPIGGMRLVLPNIAQNLNREPHSSSDNTAASSTLPSLREEPYQPPKSQETPEKGYTEGPCLIYDSGVYLYLEPTAEEASQFDTVINVAREIKNPFETPAHEINTVMSVWRNAGGRQSVVEPQTAMSERSFKSAFEWPADGDPTTPTTPRPASVMQAKRPEYLHVQWDHNSEILDDLFPLCRLIDERVNDGKKVLIHCQLGVSRSASLIIAYGLYKGYEADFHSMYMTVKKRSQWVGPNMSLIYQLTDFKTKCDKGAYANSTKQPKSEWFVSNSHQGTTPMTTSQPTLEPVQPALSVSKADTRPALRLNKELPPVPLFPKEERMSVHSDVAVPLEGQQTIKRIAPMLKKPEKSVKRSAPRGLPFREMGYSNQGMSIPPHRPRVVPGLTFAQPSMDLARQDVPAAPSLFSPRAAEFMAPPFGVTAAGDLVTTTPKSVKPPPGAFPGGNSWRDSLFIGQDAQVSPAAPTPTQEVPIDPRSPHQHGETREILRSIDDIL